MEDDTSIVGPALEWKREFKRVHKNVAFEHDYHGKCCPHIRFRLKYFWCMIKAFFSILFRFSTFVVLCVSIGSFLGCYYGDIKSDLPLNLLTVAIVFPVSFGIQFTFGRRERVLLDLSSWKCNIVALHCTARDFSRRDPIIAKRIKCQLEDLVDKMISYLYRKTQDVDFHVIIIQIYQLYDQIAGLLDDIRAPDDSVKSVMQTPYQYLRFLMIDFERLRTVSEFSSPSVFKSFTWLWLGVFPAIFSPYFSNLSQKGFGYGLYSSIICGLLLVTLANIVDDMEDPFDGDAVDDWYEEILMEPKNFLVSKTDVNAMRAEENDKRDQRIKTEEEEGGKKQETKVSDKSPKESKKEEKEDVEPVKPINHEESDKKSEEEDD
eukprot:TRINITY_DN5741_c0_g1_i1.p1 TRINITY_DN5741_c0_g1~~TRINITY_DN5741_c0_g1_i1.p1  ORF type:complete len:377 (+),score=86.38 TRINITY_DN5741_c0_g1_i1:127-1257(+)